MCVCVCVCVCDLFCMFICLTNFAEHDQSSFVVVVAVVFASLFVRLVFCCCCSLFVGLNLCVVRFLKKKIGCLLELF